MFKRITQSPFKERGGKKGERVSRIKDDSGQFLLLPLKSPENAH